MVSDVRLAGMTCGYPGNPAGSDTPSAGAEIRQPDGSTPLVAGSGRHRRSCNLAQNT